MQEEEHRIGVRVVVDGAEEEQRLRFARSAAGARAEEVEVDPVGHHGGARRRLVREQHLLVARRGERAAVQVTPGVPLLSPHLAPLDRAVGPTQRARLRARRAPHDVVFDVVLVETQDRSGDAASGRTPRRIRPSGPARTGPRRTDGRASARAQLGTAPRCGPATRSCAATPARPAAAASCARRRRCTRVGHRDDAPAVLLGRADRLLLVLARIDERQHRHVVRRRHAGDELVQTPLGAERRRAGQERRDKEDGEALASRPGRVAQRHSACLAGGRAGRRRCRNSS